MSEPGPPETPALLLDIAVLDRNLARMRAQTRRLGVTLRPHVKTAKSIDVIRRATGGEETGITVSTLREADHFLAHGVRDILYAVGIAPGKLQHVLDLIGRGAQLTLVLDSFEAARAVSEAASRAGVRIPVLIEIDVDQHRSGVPADSELVTELGDALRPLDGVRLRGVMAHAGASYECRTHDALSNIAERERQLSVQAAERLRAHGHAIDVVSVGSTPTVLSAQHLQGITEVRAGVYMFHDLVMAGIGICGIQDIALSVLVCVIGHQAERGWLITDGGWMALSRDRGTASHEVDQGYGLVRTAAGGAPADDLIVAQTNQEHGIVALRNGAQFDLARYPLGTLLRILPNHACATAAQHERYHLVSEGSCRPDGSWPRFNGW